MKTTSIKKFNTNKVVTTYGKVRLISKKITKKGVYYYFYELQDKSGKIEFIFQPEFPIVKYDFLKPSIRLHLQIKKRSRNSRVYFLTQYESFRKSKVLFLVSTDNKPYYEDINSKYTLKTHNLKQISVHWQLALNNITCFEEYTNQDKNIIVHIYGLKKSKLEIYEKIFNFISNWGHLIYHNRMGIIKKHSPEKTQRLKQKAELLSDLDYKGYACLGFKSNIKIEEEIKICELIYKERKDVTQTP